MLVTAVSWGTPGFIPFICLCFNYSLFPILLTLLITIWHSEWLFKLWRKKTCGICLFLVWLISFNTMTSGPSILFRWIPFKFHSSYGCLLLFYCVYALHCVYHFFCWSPQLIPYLDNCETVSNECTSASISLMQLVI